MKIALAQIRSETGSVDRNLEHHLEVLRTLDLSAIDLVAFPELSLSNYSPEIAEACAIDLLDRRLTALQRLAETTSTTLAVGAPIATAGGKPRIGMLIFEAGREPRVVEKRHLHADEFAAFSWAEGSPEVLDLEETVGLAICYEISQPKHADGLVALGATVIVACAAKTPTGVAEARRLLSQTARRHGVSALLVNSVGTCEGVPAGGGSFAIDPRGELVAQLDSKSEGCLVFETATESVV